MLSSVFKKLFHKMTVTSNIIKSLRRVYALYKKHEEEAKVLLPKEFIERAYNGFKSKEDEIIIELFLKLMRNEEFLTQVTQDFRKRYFLGKERQEVILIIIFITLFILSEDTINDVLDVLLEFKFIYTSKLLPLFCQTDFHVYLCETGCGYFDDDYILNQILRPLNSKVNYIYDLISAYLEITEIKIKTKKTIPELFSNLKVEARKIPPPPSNTPKILTKFKANEIPASTFNQNYKIKNKIEKLKADNHERAIKLLEQANKVSERLTKVVKKSKVEEEVLSQSIKRKAVPVFSPVKISTNLTTTLRLASKLSREKESNLKGLNELLSGGYNVKDLSSISQNLIKEEEIQEIKAIEKKHLEGLLSYEAAIIAKKHLLEENKEKYREFNNERLKFLEDLDIWKAQEENKIKTLVQKAQNIKSSASESKIKSLEEKRTKVKLQQKETKQLLERAYQQKLDELQQKVRLIKELKVLHQVRIQVKKFDPTETANLGLLCEMSIAELQERLLSTKMNMQKDIEDRRTRILQKKQEQKEMIEKVYEMVKAAKDLKVEKTKTQKIDLRDQVNFNENSEILELRRQLEERRSLRKMLQGKT